MHISLQTPSLLNFFLKTASARSNRDNHHTHRMVLVQDLGHQETVCKIPVIENKAFRTRFAPDPALATATKDLMQVDDERR